MSEKSKVVITTLEAKNWHSASQKPTPKHSRYSHSHAERFLRLQRTKGNQTVQRMIQSGLPQTKLTISKPGDKHEQEADHIADLILRMPEPQVQPKHVNGEGEDLIQTKPIVEQITPIVQRDIKGEDVDEEETKVQTKIDPGQTPEATPILSSRIKSLKGGGRPLSGSERAFYEPRFGTDFSGVRVHTDGRAAGIAKHINARAFTVDQNIVFGKGEYTRDSKSSRHLLAHELAHVIQQSNNIQKSELPQSDAAQGVSWTNPDNSSGLIAQVFFPTNLCNLDENDKNILQEIVNAFSTSLFRNRYCFRFIGYADYRGAEKYNERLALDRAKTVSEFFNRGPFKQFDFFEYRIESRGESQTHQFGRTSEQLSPYRRVDIIVEPPLVKPEQGQQERKILEPPPKEVSPAAEKDTYLGKLLPTGVIMFKVALPAGVPILVGPYLIIYPSGEIRGTFTLKTGRPETFLATWKEGKVGIVVKQKLVEGLEFKGTSTGQLGISFYSIPLNPEVMWQPLEIHKPVSVNISASVEVSKIDIGQGMIITGKVGLKLKLGVGPGPATVACFGTAGIIVGGSIAGTIGVLYATARITEAALERGKAWAEKIAKRNAYAWRIAGEATGDYGYHVAISTVELSKGEESYPAAFEGWTLADKGLNKLSAKELDFLKKSLAARYGMDVTCMHIILFDLVGGLSHDDIKLPTTPLDLI